MSSSNNLRLLAIGLDAAEPSLIQKLIDDGSMPNLAALVKEGRWLHLKAPAHIGSGSVWPTFITGTPPTKHGLYSEWIWRPAKMGLERYHGRDLVPFWKQLDEQGVAVGVLDVPFATPVGLRKGFEVSEWWAHDSVLAKTLSGPEAIGAILRELPPHPLIRRRQDAVRPDDAAAVRRFTADTREGVRVRGALAQRLIDHAQPALALIVFPETHHAGHHLWQTVAANHPLFQGRGMFSSEPLLTEVYREIDQQIGSLVDKVGANATVMVFALHGMKATFGSPGFLPELLCARGFSRVTNWMSQSWSERRWSTLAGIKRGALPAVRELYYKLAPQRIIQQVARPTMLPIYDWQHTRAFSLPTDQFGWIRVNLEGREAQGCVPLERYRETLDELESMLTKLTDREGSPLVHQLVRTVTNGDEVSCHRIPDLVVHWHDAAFASRLRIADTDFEAKPVGIKTGQHALDGFCVIRGKGRLNVSNPILAEDMGGLITQMLV